MTPPLVSILIPAYNAAPWIGRTIESALAQTWARTEIIVVDDGSTDDTAGVVRGFEASNVRLVSQSRQGPSAAQNTALRHAAGEYVQRLDADDLLSPEKIERQLERLEGNSREVAAGSWARFYRSPAEAEFVKRRSSEDLDAVEWLTRECEGGEPMLQPGIWLVPRAVAEAAGPWDERLTLNNDFEYFVRVLLASHGVRFCPDARLYYQSGIPHSLGSTRSPQGWQSALLSFELGAGALLGRASTPRARRACADLFQVLSFDAYLEDAAVSRLAEERADALGGSAARMGGGRLFRALERTIGWKRAKRVKHLAYRLGYDRVARAKAGALGGVQARVA